MKTLVCFIMFGLLAACVTEEPSNTNNQNNTNNGSNNANNATNNANNQTNNLNNQSNNSNNQTICVPDVVDCDATCGMVDDGCGTITDCGQCNCEAGVALDEPCGPCDLGEIVCAPDETGDGMCEYAAVLDGVDCTQVVYLVPGADETNAVGTLQSPFGDPNSAIIFAQMFDRDFIVVAEGTTTVPETIELDGDAGHVNILGGYTSSFRRNPAIRTAFNVEQTTALNLLDIDQPTTIQNLEFRTRDGLPGEDIRALQMESITGLDLVSIVVRAGNGATGMSGADGPNGASGAEGNDGANGNNNLVSAGACTGEYQSALGGAASTRVCGVDTLTSGRGGVSEGLAVQNMQLVCRNQFGEDGESSGLSLGGAGGDSPINAQNGQSAVGEPAAADALIPGVGEDGNFGTSGNHGGNGAGGGGGFTSPACQGSGGGGGGGGSGGCGGFGGGAGQRGGNSAALWLLDVFQTTCTGCEFFAGNGGNGGNGGAGGTGGIGGSGGTGGQGFCGLAVQVIQGGDGGNGAPGQTAGHGTGGSGGSTFGAIVMGQNELDLDSIAFTLGLPGIGGTSPVGASPNGLSEVIAP